MLELMTARTSAKRKQKKVEGHIWKGATELLVES